MDESWLVQSAALSNCRTKTTRLVNTFQFPCLRMKWRLCAEPRKAKPLSAHINYSNWSDRSWKSLKPSKGQTHALPVLILVGLWLVLAAKTKLFAFTKLSKTVSMMLHIRCVNWNVQFDSAYELILNHSDILGTLELDHSCPVGQWRPGFGVTWRNG